ncbi:N-acyl-D-glucosamine 2-epimerase [Intrasporangium oryzae NRRL B-24470]|uniref:N-acyl-D-glucosamine 2-epimerase n=1 Tax=Intrasporangium oryzae NRRL B-24470 TaxID=1386089 RepID=W9G9J0_9MICO|nr:AGE family epimerase/isomerase [Intrasporangium oryzae]EWT02735.1 N-acyl-D-glucosamine 2-epimerase [Intrasporangium oryzae NRRL B-24470]
MSDMTVDLLTDEHRVWLAQHRSELRRFARGAIHPRGGFAWLDDSGAPRLDHDVELWITARMTHVAALAVLEGDESFRDMLDHGVRAFRPGGVLHDDEYGGWYAAVGADAPTVADKRAYEHAFVVLAAASATAAGHPDGQELLTEALGVYDEKFWREDDGLAVDVWDRTWSALEDYRGVNANMHSVEAMLAAYDVTGERHWLDHAHRIVERVVHGFAAGNAYRLPEHFTAEWTPLPDYNREDPAHPFRPYGVTIGHLLEWSRLALHLRHALGDSAPEWLLTDARALFDVGVRDGWDVDGAEGFVYTTDFNGRPVVRDRLHWVVTEAIGAAWTLLVVTGEAAYGERYTKWWDHARRLFVDEVHGSWRHELSPDNVPAATVWDGKPDVYHAYQAALLPPLGQITSFAGATRVARLS